MLLLDSSELEALGELVSEVDVFARVSPEHKMALVEALRSGQLLAAGLDVFDQEPLSADAPLLELENVLLQPHVAWLTQETLGRSLAVAMENCRRLRDAEALLHRVV